MDFHKTHQFFQDSCDSLNISILHKAISLWNFPEKQALQILVWEYAKTKRLHRMKILLNVYEPKKNQFLNIVQARQAHQFMWNNQIKICTAKAVFMWYPSKEKIQKHMGFWMCYCSKISLGYKKEDNWLILYQLDKWIYIDYLLTAMKKHM